MHLFQVIVAHLFPAKLPTPDYSKAIAADLLPPGPTTREKAEFIRNTYAADIENYPALTFSLDTCEPINYRSVVAHHHKMNLTFAIHPDNNTPLPAIIRPGYTAAPKPTGFVTKMLTTTPKGAPPQDTPVKTVSAPTITVSPKKSHSPQPEMSRRAQHLVFPLTVATLTSINGFAATCHAYSDQYTSQLPGSCYLQILKPEPGLWSATYKTFGPAPGPTKLLFIAALNITKLRSNFVLLPGHVQLVPTTTLGPLLLLLMSAVELASWYNVIKLIRRPRSWKMRILEAWTLGSIDLAIMAFGLYKTFY